MRFATKRSVVICLAALLLGATAPTHEHQSRSEIVEGRHVTIDIERDATREHLRRCVEDVCSGMWFDGTQHFAYGINNALLPADDIEGSPPLRELQSNVETVVGPLQPPIDGAPLLDAPRDLPLAHEHVPIVGCTVGGVAARCVIDTGTTPSAMTLAFADRLHLEPAGEIEITGTRSFVTGIVHTGPLIAGNLHAPTFNFAVVPNTETFYDVLLGSDALAHARIRFDRPGYVRFEPTRSQPEGRAIALAFIGGTPHIDVALAGEPARQFVLDTGDESAVSIGYQDARTRYPGLILAAPSHVSGTTQRSDAFIAHAPVRIGTIDVGAASLVVARTQRVGHVGSGIFSTCRLIIDYPARRAECLAR